MDDNDKIIEIIKDGTNLLLKDVISLTQKIMELLELKHDMMDLINKRFEKGKKEYGHGIMVESDTRKWGTMQNSWKEMALEELLDAVIYLGADLCRKKKTN